MAEEERRDSISSSSGSYCKLDVQDKSSLEEQVHRLKSDNRKLQKEFHLQRTKLKELLKQKDAEFSGCMEERYRLQHELEEMKIQLSTGDMKSEGELEQEIYSLQLLVQDSMEESTICKTELEEHKAEIKRLRHENRKMRAELLQHQQESAGLTPQKLSQSKKTNVCKLESSSESDSSLQHESFDEAGTDGTKQVHGDAELLRRTNELLQEEMKALKEKLREADEKLQAYNNTRKCDRSTSMDIMDIPNSCANCQIYEQNLEEAQQKQKCLQRSHTASREDLQKEAEHWYGKCEEHKAEAQLLRKQMKSNDRQLLKLQESFMETKDDVVQQLQRACDERKRMTKDLETLKADNDFLSGRYLASAEDIKSQYINLPNTIDEWVEFIFGQHNALIRARVSSEFEHRKYVKSLDKIQKWRDQLALRNKERKLLKKKMQKDIKSLQDRLRNSETIASTLERTELELNNQIAELLEEIIELQENNEKLSEINLEQKAKIWNLQEDLATREQL